MQIVLKQLFRTTVLFIGLLILSFSGFAQERERAPKQLAFETGYRYLVSNSFNLASQGVTVLFDYGWQLSGFTGKPASYLSVPLGYTMLFGHGGARNARILSYGWTVRHNLSSKSSWVPFLGYGLLLNQLLIEELDGRVFGHQTCLDLGIKYRTQSRWHPYCKLEYCMTRYPSLGKAKADNISAVEIKTGIFF